MSAFKPPTLQHHRASGKARVRIGGVDFYCGEHGTEAAEVEYKRLVAEWMLTGRTPTRKSERSSTSVSINELMLGFLRHAQQHYVKNGKMTAEVDCFKSAMKPLRELYGTLPVDGFGPLALKTVRERYVSKGWSRTYVNKSVSRVRLMFRWGVENELVDAHTLAGLQAVAGLKAGRTEAPDHPKRMPVPQGDIDAVRSVVRQRTRDLIDLQLMTAARSGELVMLTTEMIDRSGDVWRAKLIDHKMSHAGTTRTLYFGPQAQLILTRYLNPKEPDGRLFPIRRTSYSHTIQCACRRAGVTPFVPHQLRHTAATRLREEYDLETAQTVLGHAKADMTEHYARRNEAKAVEVARAVG